MVLAIDIGNTHIVVGCFQKDRIVFVERISTNRTNTTLEYAVSFKTILEIYQIPVSEIEGNIIASVVPSVTNTVKRAVETITKQEPLLVGPAIKTGLHITIANPQQPPVSLADLWKWRWTRCPIACTAIGYLPQRSLIIRTVPGLPTILPILLARMDGL